MFSGIIEDLAVVEEFKKESPAKLTVKSSLNHTHTKIGDSIAVNGVCLTVVSKKENILEFDLSEETVSRTNFNTIKQGSKVNLERSLLIGERLHGHFVSGHVDDVVKVLSVRELEGSWEIDLSIPAKLRKYIAEKGSVALSGISLTVAAMRADSFSVSIIPHTLKSTILGEVRAGDLLNLEVDILARYVLEGRADA